MELDTHFGINVENDGTPHISYQPNAVDEYIVVVNLPEDWDEVHNYIINENEIDGIPNRKIECVNDKVFSLRSSIYMMSQEEADVLKSHPKVEEVELNPEKYPQPESLFSFKFRKNVAFNKPVYTGAADNETTSHTNSVRSNWSHLFVNGGQSSEPFQGVGITTTTKVNQDILYSLTGKGVDAVIIDSGVSVTHPEFIAEDGTYRVRDVILDGPYKVDPAAFSGYTETVTIDGVNIGTRAQEARARSWWSNTSIRSAQFQSLGTVSISSSYTRIQAHSKTGTNRVTDSHGTSCASQIGGNWHGLAFECNLWNIRIALGGSGGIIGSSTALDACTIFHNAKKIIQDVADPTLINNSYGGSGTTGNTSGVNYSIGYRGNSQTYTGTGTLYTIPANSGGARCNASFTYHNGVASQLVAYGGNGKYLNPGSTTSSAAENAIAAGCIVVASAGNNNQKLSDKDDIDFDNWYGNSSTYINRVGGVQKGFSGDHLRTKGSIRVGALDCAVEPVSAKQGSTAYNFRKVTYSSNGPMINIWSPGEYTMAASYASGEDYDRDDDSNYHDQWFNGTSAAGPNACSVIALELQTNPKANQDDIHKFLDSGPGAITSDQLSDPYPNENDAAYWSMTYNSTYDSSNAGECYNVRGNGNLRGAPRRVLNNPYASNLRPTFANVIGGESIITDNLVLHLDAADSRSYTGIGTVWYDLSGNDNDFNLYGSPTKNDDNGGSLNFDGTNDYAQGVEDSNLDLRWVNFSPYGGTSYSFGCWVKFNSSSGTHAFLASSSLFGSGGSLRNGSWEIYHVSSTNYVTLHIMRGAANYYWDIQSVSENTWSYIFFSDKNDGSAGGDRMYLNGVLQPNAARFTWPGYTFVHNDYFRIASRREGGLSNIQVNNVQVYKYKDLNDEEVLFNYNAMKGRFEQKPLILSGISYSFT